MDALHGAPGMHSHRFSPLPDATDADRRKYLLEKLQGSARPWKAHFRATVAVAQPSGKVQLATGQCDGEIIPEERGTNGFGYDPIFFIPETGRTMAELEMDEKNSAEPPGTGSAECHSHNKGIIREINPRVHAQGGAVMAG